MSLDLFFFRVLDAAVADAPADDAPELTAITKSLHAIAHKSGPDAFSAVLAHLASAMGTAPSSASPTSLMTAEQEAALREAGSLADEMPPVLERGSTRTAIKWTDLLVSSLPTAEVAQMLAVSPSRIRQRAAERTLYGVRRGAGWVFPAFQFVDGREVPGWDQVAPRIPAEEHLVAVHNLLTRPNVDLEPEGGREPLSPMQWLSDGLPVEPVTQVLDGAFARYS